MNPLTQVLDHELAAQGIDDVDSIDFEYAESAIRSLVARLKTGAEWEDHIGARIGHADVLKLTGWSKQALSQAVRGHRVLRLETDDGYTYLLAGFDDQSRRGRWPVSRMRSNRGHRLTRAAGPRRPG